MVLSLRESTAAEYAHTTVDPYTLIFNVMKLTIPMFDGSDPGGWISQIERLFDFHQAPEEWRLRLVSYHMEGEAEDWLFWALANNQLRTWPDFQFHFQQYFGYPLFEETHAQSKPLQETPLPEYELASKRLIDETTARIEDLGAKRKRIPLQESSPIGEQVKSCDVGFKVGHGRELPGNTEMTTIDSSSPNTSCVCPEDSEVKRAPSITLVPQSSNTVCHSPRLDSLQETNGAKFVVTSLELHVFDKMPKSIFYSAKEVALCLKELTNNFMEGKGMKEDTQQLDLIFDPGGGPLLDQYRAKGGEEMEINVEFTARTYPFFGNNINIDIWCFDLGVDSMQLGAGKVTELKFLVLREESMSNSSYYFIIVGEILMRYFMFDVFSLIWDGVGSNNWCRWWLTLNIDVLVTMMFLRKHLQWFNVLVSNMHKNLYFLGEALENLYIFCMEIVLEVSVLNMCENVLKEVKQLDNRLYGDEAVMNLHITTMKFRRNGDVLVDIICFWDNTTLLMIGFANMASVERYDFLQGFLVCHSPGMDMVLLYNIYEEYFDRLMGDANERTILYSEALHGVCFGLLKLITPNHGDLNHLILATAGISYGLMGFTFLASHSPQQYCALPVSKLTQQMWSAKNMMCATDLCHGCNLSSPSMYNHIKWRLPPPWSWGNGKRLCHAHPSYTLRARCL